MKRIDEVFKLHRARSDIFSRYQAGPVPYVGNGLSDNAVIGFVKPHASDRVFKFTGIAVSAFAEATVQVPPFIACGRAGNGLVVLEPITAMNVAQLAYYAAYINNAIRWRFSWYWQTTLTRLARLMVPNTPPTGLVFPVRAALPKIVKPASSLTKLKLARFALGSIYDLKAGDYHSVGHLPRGNIPMVACGDLENGVCGYFDLNKHLYNHKLTIAFNGATLAAKFHPYAFAAKDDVAVCIPKAPMRLTTQLFVQVMLSREQWRFSYYRKCYKEKLERVTVPLPTQNSGAIDEDAVEDVMKATPYWEYLHERLHA